MIKIDLTNEAFAAVVSASTDIDKTHEVQEILEREPGMAVWARALYENGCAERFLGIHRCLFWEDVQGSTDSHEKWAKELNDTWTTEFAEKTIRSLLKEYEERFKPYAESDLSLWDRFYMQGKKFKIEPFIEAALNNGADPDAEEDAFPFFQLKFLLGDSFGFFRQQKNENPTVEI